MQKTMFSLMLAVLMVNLSITAALVSVRSGNLVQTSTTTRHHDLTTALMALDEDEDKAAHHYVFITKRRRFLTSLAAPAAAASLPFLKATTAPAAAASASQTKCDAKDVLCRQKVYDEYVDSFQQRDQAAIKAGKPIPAVTNKITYVVQLIIDIGPQRDADSGYIRFGLYGVDCPGSVKQILYFLTRGITSMDKEALEDRLEVESMPVSLGDGNGSIHSICPGKGVEFGVQSQSKAYAENRGMRTAGPNFVPQGRPTPTLEGEVFPRPHSVAGLISIPAKGIGYAGGGSSNDLDEIYASAFTITADAAQDSDKPKSRQRVIGQVIDNESMQFLDRLANLPVKKLAKGNNSDAAPPLLKVRVRDVDVQKVK